MARVVVGHLHGQFTGKFEFAFFEKIMEKIRGVYNFDAFHHFIIIRSQDIILLDGPVATGAGCDNGMNPFFIMKLLEHFQVGLGDPFKFLCITDSHGGGATTYLIFAKDAEIEIQLLKNGCGRRGHAPGR